MSVVSAVQSRLTISRYPTEGAYYRDASCVDLLNSVRTPLFAINAIDDPVCRPCLQQGIQISSSDTKQVATYEALPIEEARQNPFVVLCTTKIGGHLGWFEIGGGRWYVKPVSRALPNACIRG